MEESKCPVTGLKAGEKPGLLLRIYYKFFHKKASYN
jgi:hypothetical protein